MRPTLRPSEVAPYRCGSLLGRGSEPCPLQGPSDLTSSNQAHIALPPRGSKRLGPQYWAGDSSDWLKLKIWSTGGEAGPEEDCVTDYE